MDYSSKHNSANQHAQSLKRKQGHTFFWIFLLPVILVALSTSLLNLWSLNTLGEQNREHVEYAAQGLLLFVEISQIEQQMVTIHQSAADNLVLAARDKIDEAALYRIHSKIVDDLAGLDDRITVLVENLNVAGIDQESTQIMSESFGQYRNFIIMATDIAAIDPKKAKFYIDNAQNFFMDMITNQQNIFTALTVHVNEQHITNTRSYREVFGWLMRGNFVGLLMMLLISIFSAKILSSWLNKVASALNLLTQTKGEPSALPDMARMQQNGIGQFKDMAMATIAFREALQERYEAEKELRTYKNNLEELIARRTIELQRYITAIDDIGIGLCVIDSDHKVHFKNKTLIEWFGDQSGNTCYNVFMGRKTPCTFCELKTIIKQKKTAHYQFTHSDGRTFEIVATPINNSDGTISNMDIIRDITDQKKQEAQRLEISQQKEQLQRFESLKTMAGAIAHRFNNAMMAVQGNLDLLTFTLPDDSEEYQMVSDAAKAARGASQVGSMMLSYVGQQPLKLQEIPLEMLVKESVTALKGSLLPPISLQFTPPDRSLYCSVDQEQIKEVIVSIITNAVESLNDGPGTIEITFGTDYFTADFFPISFQRDNIQDGMYTFCQIKDSGHGITPKDLSRIFEPFYTTKFVGRGLGLALTVGIMQSHHGAITVESLQDKGTTVRILFPSISLTKQITTPSESI